MKRETPVTSYCECGSSIKLRLREELDFDAGLITAYGYEVYRGAERLYWYDDFPHPCDAELASTFPHHKHIPPDIKHHRVPSPKLSFSQPNLPGLISEIEELAEVGVPTSQDYNLLSASVMSRRPYLKAEWIVYQALRY